ncbi:hypothetical protein D3C87_1313540 [compost metagenome]
MADLSSKVSGWTQTLVAVGSLVFGVGMLYGDVQDIKRDVSQTKDLSVQTKVLETKLENQKEAQDATLSVLKELTSNVNRLSDSVTRLETQMKQR